MRLPLVSVAIPAYNHAPFLQQCLDSVRAQTYPHLELVVVDDGSTDATLALAEQFAAQHSSRFAKLTIITQDNQGVSAASNRAIAACSGEWVHLLGSDDVLYPEKIARQQQALIAWQEPQVALLYSDVNVIDSAGQIISSATRKRPASGPDYAAYRWLISHNYIANPTVALRRAAFLDSGGFDTNSRLEDLDAWLRLAVNYAVARVPGVYAGYRRHASNASLQHLMMFEATWRILGNFAAQHGELIPPALWQACLRRRLRSLRRWARKHAPQLLPTIIKDALLSWVRTPEPELWLRYAALCRQLAARR